MINILPYSLGTLTHLEFGGSPKDYNSLITLDGIRILWGSDFEDKDEYEDEEHDYRFNQGLRSSLKTFRVEYCTKIGKQAMDLVCNRFGDTLENFSIIRNYYEFAAKIKDDSLEAFKRCKKLQQLEIVYSRHFDYECINNFAKYCKNLRVLNLKDCPIQEPFEPLNQGWPYLEELNLSGDSWTKVEALVSLF